MASATGLHLLPGYRVVPAKGRDLNQALIIVKPEIAGHGCCFRNRSAGEVVNGCVAAAFETQIRLRRVNCPKKGAVAGETDFGVAGQTIISKVLCLAVVI